MSTGQEPPNNHQINTIILGSKNEPEPVVQALTEAQDKIQSLKDRLSEDRFYFGLIVALLLDVLILKDTSWWLCIPIMAVEIAIFLCLAERCGVKAFPNWMEKCMAFIQSYHSKENKPSNDES